MRRNGAPTAPPANAASADTGALLFDGKTLSGWKVTEFGGEGDVAVEDGSIILNMGNPLTGVTYAGDRQIPKMNYEVTLEAKRLEGVDFFCGLTFPVADSYCSLILSGWAGSITGLSSIDGFDASENDTTQFVEFDDNRWYRVRVRVTPERIGAWVDDKQIIDQDIVDRRVSTRIEVDLSQPLGVASFETKAALRNIRVRRLAD